MKKAGVALLVAAAFAGGILVTQVLPGSTTASVTSRSALSPTSYYTQRPTATPVPAATRKPVPASTKAPTAKPKPQPTATTYIINKKTKKFHKPSCSSVKQMLEKNKVTKYTTRTELIKDGYDPCGRCHP